MRFASLPIHATQTSLNTVTHCLTLCSHCRSASVPLGTWAYPMLCLLCSSANPKFSHIPFWRVFSSAPCWPNEAAAAYSLHGPSEEAFPIPTTDEELAITHSWFCCPSAALLLEGWLLASLQLGTLGQPGELGRCSRSIGLSLGGGLTPGVDPE